MKHINLSSWAIKNQSMVLYLLLALLLAGSFAYFKLPQKEDPDFTFKVMTVRVQWPGATAREMERQVTDRIERALQETPWLDSLNSYSKPGEAVVFVTLKDEMPPAELGRAWQAARKHLDDLRPALPEDVQGPFVDDEFGDTFGAIYALTFRADQAAQDRAELEHQAQLARVELLKLKGIGKINTIGTQRENIFIEFSSKQIAAIGIDPAQIGAILKTRNAMEPAGEVLSHDGASLVRVSGDFHSLKNIQDIGIPVTGKIYRLGDISHVYRSFEDPHFKMRHQGREAVGLAVLMLPEADVASVGRELDDALTRIRNRLPAGMQIEQVADQSRVVKKSVGEFMHSLLEALAIVLAIGFLSLGWRAGLVVALSIPVVMAGTFLLMNTLGIDLHRVSIGALIIAIGLLVDDAMIAVEMMKVKLEQGWGRAQAVTYAYQSTAFPMLTGTLITAAAFLPVGLAKSSAGEYTFSICAVVTIALLVSWLVAVIFTPFIGYRLLREHTDHQERMYHNRFYSALRKLVAACLVWRKSVIFATLVLFALALAGFARVEQQFFPPSERLELLMDVWLPEGATYDFTESYTRELERHLQNDNGIDHYTSYVGGSSPRFYLPLDLQLPTVNYAQIVITTRDLQAREAVLKRLRQVIDRDYPDSGVRIARLENGPPVGYPIQFRVIGESLEQSSKIADEVLRVVKANPHTKHASQDSHEPIRALHIEVDQDKARALGISSQGLSRYLQTLLSGSTVTYYREKWRRIGVVIRAADAERKSAAFLAQLKVFSANGQLVPLSSFAKITEDVEDGIVWRLNRQPVVTVRADVPDDVQAPEVSQAINARLAELRAKLPQGYRIEAGGEMDENDKATDSIIAVLPLTCFVILTLLMLQLRSFNLLVLVLLTAPLGLIGVAAVLLPFHVAFGFVAMLGMISLAGMIMRNSVILVDQIKQDMAQGLSRYDAIIDSTVRRARPILLTAAAAILAMIPLTSSVFWGPMAIVIMGGLTVATLLTLLFLPALYAAWFRVKAAPKP